VLETLSDVVVAERESAAEAFPKLVENS
jgi:hypothetical protein